MNLTRRLTVLIVMMVPAIVGGGLVYAISGQSYPIVAVYEALLAAGVAVLLVKGLKPAE